LPAGPCDIVARMTQGRDLATILRLCVLGLVLSLSGLLLPAADALAVDGTGAGTSLVASAGAVSSKLSGGGSGPEFKVGTWTLRDVAWDDLRFNGGDVLSAETPGPHDAKGVPFRPLGPGGSMVYNPTTIAQHGMRRLDSYVQSRDPVHLRHARRFARTLDKLSSGQSRRWQPHGYRLGRFRPGWVNANSQGLILSFLTRFYVVTGATSKLAEAKRLMAAFKRRPGPGRWFTKVTPGGHIWFEHWPGSPRHNHTLNGHINALFGIYDYWHETGSPLAERYFLGGTRTVRDQLHRFLREGDLSRYSLGSPGGSLKYHKTHIGQLRVLAAMTGDDWFATQADLFQQDEDEWRASKNS